MKYKINQDLYHLLYLLGNWMEHKDNQMKIDNNKLTKFFKVFNNLICLDMKLMKKSQKKLMFKELIVTNNQTLKM